MSFSIIPDLKNCFNFLSARTGRTAKSNFLWEHAVKHFKGLWILASPRSYLGFHWWEILPVLKRKVDESDSQLGAGQAHKAQTRGTVANVRR